MNKLILIALVLVFAYANSHAQSIPKWKLNDLKTAISKTEKPTIFNFWATFCKPCVAEIPYFQQLVKKYEKEGVELVLISLDLSEAYPKQISSFATKYKFTSPIKFLAETNADLFCPAVDESWSGAIPASLFVNNKTGYRKFFEEQLSKEKLEKEIKAMIKK
jgi:thiol-disulfide isomerase/thioredoxin